jgi:hypothetical protein|tara:strand:+ start:383 stop:811 length:429 start_codon:yes stop_codon:yes gene_type:complete
MAIPDTTTFNLINVTDEFGLSDGDGLQDCFNDSSAGDFDGDYNPNSDGTNNNLLNFRNYGGADPVWSYNAATSSSSSNICAMSLSPIVYQRQPTSSPAFDFNDPIYSNSGGTAFAASGWWRVGIKYKYWTGTAWSGTTSFCP